MSDTSAPKLGSDIGFVRKAMLPPASPPVAQAGAIRWARENLFSGPINTILTILSLALVIYGVMQIWPWFARSVWNANSLTECRDIIKARYGDGATGACWAMLRERWHQYLFGFYPSDLYWRPVLAFVLLIVAVAPVLFVKVPRQVLWFSAIYPAIAFWLLWGGTVWVPVTAVAGFVVGYLAYRILTPIAGTIIGVGAAAVLPVVWWIMVAGPLAGTLQGMIPADIRAVGSRQFGGFVLAFTIGFTGIAFSLPLGILLALGRQSDLIIVKTLSVGFIEFIRGVPLITLLFTASLLLNYFLPPGTDFDIILRVIIMVTLFAAAYMAEVIRGGLAALPKGQYEAADALGLDYWKAQRLIILPQALKISIPGIVNTFIGLFKDTTLVVFVGLLDPLKGITDAVRADINWKGIYWEPYIFVGTIFFIFCFGMSRYSMYLERKLKTDHR
jgi:general L-amino acid transport system permease protein